MKKLDKETEDILCTFVSENYPFIKDFRYEIINDGKSIALSQEVDIPDDPKILEDIGKVEKILNVTFARITIFHGRHSFVYDFNE